MGRLIPVFRRSAICAVLCVSILASSSFALGLDATFGGGGKFMTVFSDTGDPSTSASRVFVQPSGRIVVVGRHQQQGADGRVTGIAIAGLTIGGVLDTNFGTGGKVLIWNSGGHALLQDAQMLADGSLLLFYQLLHVPNIQMPVLVKYTPTGQIDGTFNADPRISPAPTTLSIKLALGATAKIYALVGQGSETFLVRFNSDGSRDGTFAAEGVRNVSLKRVPTSQRFISGLHELEGGKILITGHYEEAGTFYYNGFAIRFDSDTNIDRSFGRQGLIHVEIPGGSVGFTRSMVLPDGKLLLGGYYTFLGSYALLVRLTVRGRYDASFGRAGISMTSIEDINVINGMALAPDHKVLVSGTTSDKTFPTVQQLWVARFTSGGVRESFSSTTFLAGRHAGGEDVALQPDGKIVAAGFTQNPTGFWSQLTAARFVP